MYLKRLFVIAHGIITVSLYVVDISYICIDIAPAEPVSFCPVYLQCLFIIVHGLFVVSLEFVEDSETVIVVTDIKGPAQRLVDLQRLFKKAVSLFRPSLNSHYRTDISYAVFLFQKKKKTEKEN